MTATLCALLPNQLTTTTMDCNLELFRYDSSQFAFFSFSWSWVQAAGCLPDHGAAVAEEKMVAMQYWICSKVWRFQLQNKRENNHQLGKYMYKTYTSLTQKKTLRSNQHFHQQLVIILWSLWSFWVERVDLDQSQKNIFEDPRVFTNVKICPKTVSPQIEIRSNDLSQIEAMPLLTSPACFIQFILHFLYEIEKPLNLRIIQMIFL